MAKGSDMTEMIKIEEGDNLYMGGSEWTAICSVVEGDAIKW